VKIPSHTHMIDSEYLQCSVCRKLIHDPALELARVASPCPFCGEFGSSRGIWPSLDALKLLELAFAQDLNSEDDHRVGVLFLASGFEVMLADILEILVNGHSASNRLSEMVLDEWNTLTRQKKLLNGLCAKPIGDILNTPEGQQFLQDWDVLANQRNNLAHGHYYYRGSLDALVLDRLKKQAFHLFAKLHNHVEDQTAIV
jgi:hypothetical protein